MATRNQQKHLEFSFLLKPFLFTRELALILEMVLLLKIKRRDFFSTIQHSYVGVTHFENSEVRIAVFSPMIYQRTDTWMTSRFDCFRSTRRPVLKMFVRLLRIKASESLKKLSRSHLQKRSVGFSRLFLFNK